MIRLENKNNNSENESNRLMIDVFKMLLDSEAVMDLAYNTFIIWSGKSHCEVIRRPSICMSFQHDICAVHGRIIGSVWFIY